MKYHRGVSVSEDTEKLNRKWRSIAESFSAKECISICPKKPPNQDCCQCGRLVVDHQIYSQRIAEEGELEGQQPWFQSWSSATHTQKFPTNAFGVMEFQGVFNTSRAKYVRLSDDTSESDVLKLLTNLWNLKLPKLLIEVTGGAKDFVLNPKLKRIFYDGIIRVAVTADAWILTGGTNTGVMKYVGKAIREHSLKSQKKIVAIGVASWGIVDHREDLIVAESFKPRTSRAHSRAHNVLPELGQKHCLLKRASEYQEGVKYYRVTSSSMSAGASLDPNHSHFILVDNGTVKQYGVEITLRSKLEKLISKQTLDEGERCIPAVCIVLEGGRNTIQVVFENVTSDPPIPVVIAEGSGRAADVLAFAYSVTKQNKEMSKENKSKLMNRIKEVVAKDDVQSTMENIMEIVTKRELLTVFSVDSEVCAEGLDHTILQALVKANNLPANDQLQLALIWNRVDIAKEKIFKLDNAITEDFLNEAMFQALRDGKPKFVKLLLENGVSMHTFLTEDNLLKLYELSLNAPDSALKLLYDHSNIKLRLNERASGALCLHHVGRLMEELIRNSFKSSYTTERLQRCRCQAGEKRRSRNPSAKDSDETFCGSRFPTPFSDLFLWAILSRKYEMAYLMWQQGTEALAKSIIAVALYSAMSQVAAEQFDMGSFEKLDAQANHYKKISYDMLQVCFEENREYTRQLILVELKNWSNETIMSLAAAVNHNKLIGHPCVQALLTDQWIGKLQMISNRQVILGLLFPPVVAMLSYREVDVIKKYNEIPEEPTTEDIIAEAFRLTDVNDSPDIGVSRNEYETAPREVTSEPDAVEKQALSIRQCYYAFYTAPIVKFWSNTLMYVAFLLIFSYMVLVKIPKEHMGWMGLSLIEWVVMVLVFSLAAEEIRQVITQGDSSANWTYKLKSWSSDVWNIWDAICILLFFVGFFMRIAARHIISQNDEEAIDFLIQNGRILYCIDIIFWYIRLLDVLSVSKLMGPYVNMIGRMLVDMVRFTIILGVFVTSYGVASHGIMKPDQRVMSFEVIKDVFYQPYWHVYGELFLDERNPDCDVETCENGSMLVPLIMAIYLLFANILLINMLIAIFNNTFISVQQNALEIWKFQRYRIILEFRERPLFPPPLILISHFWQIGKELVAWLCGQKVTTHKMKLHLTDSTQSVLYSFEEGCVENYLRQNVLRDQSSQERTVHRLEERLDAMQTKFAEHLEAAKKVQTRFKSMEEKQERTLEGVKEVLHLTMETYRLSDSHTC
ncbi:transient receptor potential cation channel subfamily M member 3-like [Anneissia japonica]|uniref:transient receptor potential cation channel subfamily M member 3-like n=1 Tax=Anneissia japonica TaxID=1529436 RepID=UPI0014257FE4|nr:transient receptor potential cation channel subfamily M member 3-like [Anneissia japonica]